MTVLTEGPTGHMPR
uniref:Uncharacterized protein n=1 Tax=Timema shepardi TaxID=629360 RepID=A0A7R9BDC8_TIMSH|nr:unnamed protein product [Timema shepardi]